PRKYTVQLIRRQVRHGPAHAELEGIRRATNELIVKMDGDGQHDVAYLPVLCERVPADIDVVIASRYVRHGGTRWPAIRGLISRSARLLSWTVIPSSRSVQDPISGYFLLRRGLVYGLDDSLPRYKLLLYVIAANPG